MRARRPSASHTDLRPCVNPHAAGWEIGYEASWAGVPEDRDAEPVRSFGTLTPDLDALADGLAASRMETVAMASTGVYGMPGDEMLEARGCRVHLVHARHLTHVPGRKRDATDGQRRQPLHPCGLLRGSCRPEAEMCAVRAYVRHRAAWLEYRAAPRQPRPKARHQLHVQCTQGLTDITGVTGRALIRAMVAGARDPVHLARLRAPRWASRTEDSAKALPGHDQPEPVVVLQQALALYAVSTAPGREGDAAIARRFQASKPVGPDELPPLTRANKHRTHHKHAPDDDARGWR
jgi:transposase